MRLKCVKTIFKDLKFYLPGMRFEVEDSRLDEYPEEFFEREGVAEDSILEPKKPKRRRKKNSPKDRG